MRLPRFDVLVPNTIEEACNYLISHKEEGVKVLGGGTDLLVDLREQIVPQHVPRCDGCSSHPDGKISSTIDCNLWSSEPQMVAGGTVRAFATKTNKPAPKFLVSLHKIKMLKGIEQLDDGRLRMGAFTTIREIERSQMIRDNWPALSDGADSLGSPLVRNRGTVGGNIANARPAADTVIPIIALGGILELQSSSAIRTVAAGEFPTGPGTSVIQPDEILTSVLLPKTLPHSGSAYYKLANRKALEISTVGVAVWLALEAQDGPISDVRISLGAVGPTPLMAPSAQDYLINKKPTDDILEKASQLATGDARPIDDHRGSASYRLEMVKTLTERMLKAALKRAMN
jgi:carbon-monoxide dehydrogenase medium subunit